MDIHAWITSIDNPTRAKYVAHKLWKQGTTSRDRASLMQSGYSKHDADILCKVIRTFETLEKAKTDNFNKDIGF